MCKINAWRGRTTFLILLLQYSEVMSMWNLCPCFDTCVAPLNFNKTIIHTHAPPHPILVSLTISKERATWYTRPIQWNHHRPHHQLKILARSLPIRCSFRTSMAQVDKYRSVSYDEPLTKRPTYDVLQDPVYQKYTTVFERLLGLVHEWGSCPLLLSVVLRPPTRLIYVGSYLCQC